MIGSSLSSESDPFIWSRRLIGSIHYFSGKLFSWLVDSGIIWCLFHVFFFKFQKWNSSSMWMASDCNRHNYEGSMTDTCARVPCRWISVLRHPKKIKPTVKEEKSSSGSTVSTSSKIPLIPLNGSEDSQSEFRAARRLSYWNRFHYMAKTIIGLLERLDETKAHRRPVHYADTVLLNLK